MLTLKLKEIKAAAAIDVTNGTLPDGWQHWRVIGLSYGVYGMNGGLFQNDNGKLYKITARSSNLFRLA